jgi:divinyl protochlorophyllide a 8-vinyl-reductase
VPSDARRPAAPRGRVGPNAVIQLDAALVAGPGEAAARAVFTAAGLWSLRGAPPEAMVDEAVPARLFRATRAVLAPGEADAVLAEAGRRTAAYVLAHRLPKPVQAAMRVLPAALARPVLLAAIRSNAWTFAGSGVVTVRGAVLEIAANPLATPGCPWHRGVLETMARRLVAADAVARHTACCAEGAPACRFVLTRAQSAM